MIGIKKMKKNKKGSALLMTMLILFGIIAVAFGGATLVIAGLRSSDLSSKSTIAYYNAESGVEQTLHKVRSGSYDLGAAMDSSHFEASSSIFSETMSNGGSYYVDYDNGVGADSHITFTSIGDFKGIKRSAEVSF